MSFPLATFILSQILEYVNNFKIQKIDKIIKV